MALYTMYSDFDRFAVIGYDEKQIISLCGSDRFNFIGAPKPFKDILTETLSIDFTDDSGGLAGTVIPEIQEYSGRMFLNEKAYHALKDIIKDDGEFFPVTYEKGAGYIFNPLRLAEDVDGLDVTLCIKNEWGDIENMGFHEKRVSKFAIFKTEFETYQNFYCREDVKDAIEGAALKGMTFTSELGAEFGMAQDQKRSPN